MTASLPPPPPNLLTITALPKAADASFQLGVGAAGRQARRWPSRRVVVVLTASTEAWRQASVNASCATMSMACTLSSTTNPSASGDPAPTDGGEAPSIASHCKPHDAATQEAL